MPVAQKVPGGIPRNPGCEGPRPSAPKDRSSDRRDRCQEGSPFHLGLRALRSVSAMSRVRYERRSPRPNGGSIGGGGRSRALGMTRGPARHPQPWTEPCSTVAARRARSTPSAAGHRSVDRHEIFALAPRASPRARFGDRWWTTLWITWGFFGEPSGPILWMTHSAGRASHSGQATTSCGL